MSAIGPIADILEPISVTRVTYPIVGYIRRCEVRIDWTAKEEKQPFRAAKLFGPLRLKEPAAGRPL